MRKKAKKSRSRNGISIIEFLVTIVIMSMAMLVISELSVMITTAVVKTTNKVEGLEAARIAVNRISADIRHSRCIGDFYGPSRRIFPSPNNPLYSTRVPPGGWPVPPWEPNMVVSETILILQIPVIFEDPLNPQNPSNGMPLVLPVDHFGTGLPPVNMENLDTVVYQVVADAERPGEYLLQVARFPGEQLPGLTSKVQPMINPPQTILRGLIGPTVPPSKVPSVFSYLARVNTTPPIAIIDPNAGIDNVSGVGIDLVIKKTGLKTEQGDGRFPSFFGIHAEEFMQGNRNMNLKNTSNI